MKNKLVKMLLVLFICIFNPAYGRTLNYKECEKLILYYGLDLDIKSDAGWKRTLKYKKLQQFTPVYIINYEKLEQCILNKINKNKQFINIGERR